MASTVIAGKPSNTVGEKDSTLILRGSSVKILWGNKFIDIIKNGKINADTDILKVAKDTNELNTDGVYLIDNSVWAVIKGTKIELTGEVDNAYISYLIELKDLTADLKNLALTNIGFYYNTLEDAKAAEIKAGIIYVQNDNKLYVVKDGTISEYSINPLKNDQENLEENSEIIELTGLYIKDYSLWVNDYEHVNFENSAITLFYLLVTDYSGIKSFGSTNNTGFRLYIDKDNKSVLELDKLELRIYPTRVTFWELYKLILNSSLKPKKYYMITDFLNPWEVTWEDELMFYKHEYREINGVLRMIGHRNAMHLIVLAANYNTLKLNAWSLENPKWVIHYDPYYLGPKHGKQYGFRSRINNEGGIEYLNCKGLITYLKDEFGNEGNFNFRQHMFKHTDCWRYCVDKYPVNLTNYFGEFLECYNNIFNFELLETNVQVFNFKEVLDSSNNVTGYTIEAIDSDKILTKGHHLYINGTTINNNVFNLDNYQKDIILLHTITSDILENNSFIKIKKSITCSQNLKSNYFEDIEGELNIQSACSDNTVINIKSDVVIQAGTLFDRNKIFNFNQWLDNTKIFIENTINGCSGFLTNKGTMSQNNINVITGTLITESQMVNNNIETVKDLNNTKNFENNDITTITNIVNSNVISDNIFITVDSINNSGLMQENMIDYIKSLGNSGTFTNNTISNIATDLVNANHAILDNTIAYINTLTINGNILNNTITNLINTTVNSDISNNTATTITDCQFDDFCTDNIFRETVSRCKFGIFTDNRAYKELNDCTFTAGNINSSIFIKTINNLTVSDTMQGCTFNYINNLVLDKPVYYTTFHGSIGNITRKLTDYEWLLLQDSTKKTDAYPNMLVVCVPEIILPGMILMWYGSNTIPEGWALCDGNNGTPNLVGSFVKGDSVNATEPTTPEGINPETNELTLETKHLPKHRHPHTHTLSELLGTAEPTTIEVLSDTTYLYKNDTNSASTGIEGASTVSVMNNQDYKTVVSSGSHSHTVTISGGTVLENTESQDKWEYGKTLPLKIEPKHFKIIFIMKIDKNRK